VVVLRAAA